MRHIEQLVPALLAASCWWWRVAHCAVAAPAAAAAPRIRDYTWVGTGCPPDSEVYLSAKQGKLMAQMPQFSVVAGDTDAFMMNCNLYLNMNGALAGYRLAIKSVSLEGYLLSRGQIDTEMWTRVNWVGGPEPSKRLDPLEQTIQSDGVKLQLSHQTIRVPLEYSSDCFSVDGQQIDLLIVGWRLRLNQGGEDSYGAFMGMDGAPVLGTVEFEWVPCEAPSVDIDIE